MIHHQSTEYYFIKNLNGLNFIYDLFRVKMFLNSLVSFAHFYEVAYYIQTIASKLTKFTIPIHDYYFLCPSIFLLNKDKKYCNIPSDNRLCDDCFKNYKFNRDFKNIANFRQMWQVIFDLSNQILVFSHSSKEMLNKVYNIQNDKYMLIPHKVTWINRKCKNSTNKTHLNIGILGHLCLHKGLGIMEDLFEKSLNLPYMFILFGNLSSSKNYMNLTICGEYHRKDIVDNVEKYDIDIFVMPSICPETFSYTTEEIILMNKPIICFNLGAQAERVRKYHKGYIANEISAKGLQEQIINFCKNSKSENFMIKNQNQCVRF